jgi:ABC-type bacteriocin/lantibiotic exporter with double-glycine peptidase domain
MFRCTARLVACLFLCGTLFAAERPNVWLDVPFVKEEKNACGAASMAMVMQYWEHQQGKSASADAEQIQRTLYSRQAHGIYASAMKRYLQQHGFQTLAFQGEWQDLKELLEKGRPLIVALKVGRADLHYVVVAGLDWQQGVVLKNDPAERKLLKQARPNFEKQWKAAGNWTLLAVPQPDD